MGGPAPCELLMYTTPMYYGNCYTISGKNFPDKRITRPGHRFGLAVELDVKEWEYGGQSFTAGVGAQVNNNNFLSLCVCVCVKVCVRVCGCV